VEEAPVVDVTEEPVTANVVVLTGPIIGETAPVEEAVPTAEPTVAPPSGPSFPCQGEDGKCIYITRSEDDPFCRKCDRNDNGIEDAKE
jgi:hypothetical protein